MCAVFFRLFFTIFCAAFSQSKSGGGEQGFFGSAFGLGSDFGFGSSTGLGFGSGFGFSAGGLEKVKFFHEKQKQNYCRKQDSLFSLWIGRHHCCDLFLWSESNFV